ncbi:putative ankyrin repeat protein [Hordeum vulgare]|nr:putative ankyrin repeat protein [Hordeum vulgare]
MALLRQHQSEHGHDELIQELASFGDKSLLSARNSALDTPLHCAARAGHDKVLVQLAGDCGDEGILCCKNESGDTALHLAARLGHGAAVEAMVSAAPDLASEVNDAGVSPLYLAVMSRSVRAVRAITIDPVRRRVGCRPELAERSSRRRLPRLRLLLDWKPCGPSLASQADGTGSTPLHFASSDGDLSIVSAILSAVPPSAVHVRDSDGGLSALHVAAGMGHVRVAEALMKACPDAAELRDDRGGTFVHAAARGGHFEVVRLAIKKQTLLGILNTQDGDGNTPLHLAVAARAPAVAEALMSKGKARADDMNKDGQTPLDLAAKSTSFFSMVSLVATLAAFGAQPRPERRDHVQEWNHHDMTKAIEKTSDSLAVIAV